MYKVWYLLSRTEGGQPCLSVKAPFCKSVFSFKQKRDSSPLRVHFCGLRAAKQNTKMKTATAHNDNSTADINSEHDDDDGDDDDDDDEAFVFTADTCLVRPRRREKISTGLQFCRRSF